MARDLGTEFTFTVPDETMHMLVDAAERQGLTLINLSAQPEP
jgi:hypothetical protein